MLAHIVKARAKVRRRVWQLLNQRTGWPEDMRLLVRRVRPSARHRKSLTAFETGTSWKYSIIATNIGQMWGIAGSHHPQWLARWLARTSSSRTVSASARRWACEICLARAGRQPRMVLTATLGDDLDCWLRLLTLHDQPGLDRAEPDAMRYRLYHLPPDGHPSPPPTSAHRAHLALGPGIRPGLAAPHRPAYSHLRAGPDHDDPGRSLIRARGPRRPRNVMRRPAPTASGT
ncbi:hypothetical protein [Nonomuraea gerenzanensis]|uniref:hypothetical protein n=1 Tax=Nonomuraea gerenzanensis TaxID=93944 RepID=UPI001CD94ABA|nr:hypothetical protein [Nonomuraea gerenzanensis]UBU12690.1 hypothetical protein LCN96_51945 [Nonomuraea gerenzanensis]